MKTFRRTALSLAAAQAALTCSGVAFAQSNDSPRASEKEPQKIETVVVQGRRAALANAQKIKQDSDEVVDSVVAEEIGKLPDRSVSEVLQRVPGVALSRVFFNNDFVHYSVEGSGVTIRGLNYVAAQFNGRETFSANQGRSLGFEDVPPELLAGVDVYKNPSAEQIEGGISGLVNLRTAMPLDFPGFKAAFSANVTHGTLEKKTKPTLSGLISNSWNTDAGKFGVLVDLAHSVSSTRTDGMSIDPYYKKTPASTTWYTPAISWREQSYDRTRDGVYGALQWRGEKAESSLTYFKSKYKFAYNEFNVVPQINNPELVSIRNGVYDANGVLLKGVLAGQDNGDGTFKGIEVENQSRLQSRKSQTEDLSWKFGYKPNDRWTLTTDFQYLRSKTSGQDFTVGTAVQLPKENIDLTGKFPRVSFDAPDLAYINDPSHTYWAMMMDHVDTGKGNQKALKLDARYVFSDNPVLNDLRFGVRVATRHAETMNSLDQNNIPQYNWSSITHSWQQGWSIKDLAYITNSPSIPTNRGDFSRYMGGKASLPGLYFPDPSVTLGWPNSFEKLHQLYVDLCKPVNCTTHAVSGDLGWQAARFGDYPGVLDSQDERTTAAFSQLRFSFDELGAPIDGNVGVRVIRTHDKAAGFESVSVTQPDAKAIVQVPLPAFSGYQRPTNFDQSYTDVLPSLNLRYKATNNLQFRFAVSKAVSRPAFTDTQSYLPATYSLLTDPASGQNGNPQIVNGYRLSGNVNGNPDLKPVKATQEDLTAEWYFAKNGSLTVAAFNKNLRDVIINQTYTKTLTDAQGHSLPFLFNGPVNGAKGTARGVEVGFQTYFDKVADWLAPFGVQANYTYVDSKMHRYNSVRTPFCSAGSGTDNINLYANGCDTDGSTFGPLPLYNLSRNTYNLALLYDQGPLSARLAYSWRQKYLYGVALNSDNTGPNQNHALDTNPASATYGKNVLPVGLPVWAGDFGQLDAGIHYKVTENLSFGLEGQNLLNAAYKQLMQQGIGMKLHNYYVSGRRYTANMQYTF